MKEVTLKDIAKILGISVTTVSKALKGYKDVSEETRRSVMMLAENLNYKPNAIALNLKNQETKTIGLVIPEIVHTFFSNVVKGVVSEAEENGYLVITLQSSESNLIEKKQLEMLVDKRVDGILLAIADETETYEHLENLLKKEMPLVLFDKVTPTVNCSKVTIDDRKAAYEAVKLLIDSGCKKIAHLRGPLGAPNAADRHEGYVKVLEENGITYDPGLVYLCDGYSVEDGKKYAQKALKEHTDIDAFFTITDHVATGVLLHLNRNGIKVPEQVSVVGFSNSPISQVVIPGITTTDQSAVQMGREAVSLLLKEIATRKEKKPVEYFHVQLPTKLIQRASTKAV